MFKRFGASIRRFMYGRYGSDQLNMALLIASLVLSLVNSILSVFFDGSTVFSVVFLVIALFTYVLLFFAIFRIFSRNVSRRRRENQRFLNGWSRFCDHRHRYFHCPQCHQLVRVPRNRGKVSIRCPKCGEKFIKKT